MLQHVLLFLLAPTDMGILLSALSRLLALESHPFAPDLSLGALALLPGNTVQQREMTSNLYIIISLFI